MQEPTNYEILMTENDYNKQKFMTPDELLDNHKKLYIAIYKKLNPIAKQYKELTRSTEFVKTLETDKLLYNLEADKYNL